MNTEDMFKNCSMAHRGGQMTSFFLRQWDSMAILAAEYESGKHFGLGVIFHLVQSHFLKNGAKNDVFGIFCHKNYNHSL